MKRIYKIMLSFALLLMSANFTVNAKSKAIDLETNLDLRNATVLSGERNHISLIVKSTGPKTIIEDLELSLDFSPLLLIDNETLVNNIPKQVDYELSNGKLIFKFDYLDSGSFYDIPIPFTVPNGIIKDNEQFEFTLSGEADGYQIANQQATMTVLASSPLKINKEYVGLAEDGLEGALGIAPGLTGRWKTKAVISHADYGQMFIKEGTTIRIVETFDHETLEFVRVEGIKAPMLIQENTLIWEFEAPSYETQSNEQVLFYEEFDVIYRVKTGLKIDDKLENQGATASLEFINIKDENLSDLDEARTNIYPAPEDTPEVAGSWWIPGHFGPSSPFNEHSTEFTALNTRPTVYEWAKLKYAHQVVALDYGEYNTYKSYDIFYYINKHLILDEIKTPGRFLYRPNREHGDATYLEEQPLLDVIIYGENDQILNRFNDLEPNTIISRDDILKNHKKDTRIEKVVYSFSKFVPGSIVDDPEINPQTGYTDLPTYSFSISPDWKKDASDNLYQLKNEMKIEVERSYPEGYKEIYEFREGKEYDYLSEYRGKIEKQSIGWYDLSSPRWASVTEEKEAYIPTISNTVELLNHDDGLVYSEGNILRIEVNNGAVSTGALLPNAQSYVLIPQSIHLDTENLNSKEEVTLIDQFGYYNIYKINWNNDLIIPGEKLSLDIESDVKETLRDLNLFHYLHISENEDFKILKVDEPTLQDSVLVSSPDFLTDLNIDNLVLTKNNYRVLSDYYVEVEKFVKAESDENFKKSTEMKKDEIVTYKLLMTNKKGSEIDQFALMDILPHKDDVGITNFVKRGSQFNLELNGPIQIDDRFEVFYSQEKAPSREVLNNLVSYEGFDKIGGGNDVNWLTEKEVQNWDGIYSFYIKLKDDELIEINEQFELTFGTNIPQNDIIDQSKSDVYAYNSFALTANGSPVIEPLQVAVKLSHTPQPTEPEKPVVPTTPTIPEKPNEPEKTGRPPLPQTGMSNATMRLGGMIAVVGALVLRLKKKRNQ